MLLSIALPAHNTHSYVDTCYFGMMFGRSTCTLEVQERKRRVPVTVTFRAQFHGNCRGHPSTRESLTLCVLLLQVKDHPYAILAVFVIISLASYVPIAR